MCKRSRAVIREPRATARASDDPHQNAKKTKKPVEAGRMHPPLYMVKIPTSTPHYASGRAERAARASQYGKTVALVVLRRGPVKAMTEGMQKLRGHFF